MHNLDTQHDKPSLQDKLEKIYTLRSADMGRVALDAQTPLRGPYKDLLERLGNPHLSLTGSVVHIAGTNGKGSTLAFLRSCLEHTGRSVNLYSSPHLLRFNERIVLSGEQISDEDLEQSLDHILDVAGDLPLSFFELTTALAFWLFEKNPADFHLLETGLGGRLDCTNIVPKPDLTIITAIGLDHMEFLGPTITEIAREKGGIIKQDVPCIIGPQSDESLYVLFEQIAKTHKSPCLIYGRDFGDNGHTYHDEFQDKGESKDKDEGDKRDKTTQIPLPPLGLKGVHQHKNAVTALAAFSILSKDRGNVLNITAAQNGLEKCHWPARLQNVSTSSLSDALADGSEIWLDGGHNKDAGYILAQTLAEWKVQDKNAKKAEKPVYIICGLMAHKDMNAFLSPLTEISNAIYMVPIEGETSLEDVRNDIKNMDKSVAHHINAAHASVQDCLAKINKTEPVRVLICGSLYLAGNILRDIENEGS